MIEEVTSSDLDGLAEMFDQYRQFYRQPSDMEGARRFLAERISLKDSLIYIAKEENEYSGFVQCYPLFTSVGMKKLWLLNDLFVKEKFRRRGISRLLIVQCKQLARKTGAKGLMLETEKSNAPGNMLYPNEGFILNTESNFYTWTI